MNPWVLLALGLLLCLIPCAWLSLRGDVLQRLVGFETAGLIIPMILLSLAVAYHQQSFTDLAIASALLVFGGGLVFARFFERWF